MTNRSEEQFFDQVRDTFSGWEPSAPAGVKEAVYAEMGKGGFWQFSLTQFNGWMLVILGGAAALLLGLSLPNDESVQAEQLPVQHTHATEWTSSYPAPVSDWPDCQSVAEVEQVIEQAQPEPVSLASEAPQKRLWIVEEAPEALASMNLVPLTTEVSTPWKLNARDHVLSQDIWSQLQDEERNELKLIYNVNLSE